MGEINFSLLRLWVTLRISTATFDTHTGAASSAWVFTLNNNSKFDSFYMQLLMQLI